MFVYVCAYVMFRRLPVIKVKGVCVCVFSCPTVYVREMEEKFPLSLFRASFFSRLLMASVVGAVATITSINDSSVSHIDCEARRG